MSIFRKLCSTCIGLQYSEGCKKCDDDYYSYLIACMQNDLACIEHAKDANEIKRALISVYEVLDEMYELRPINFYQNLLWRL